MARHGGEEFALVLVGAGTAVLERLHAEWTMTDPLTTFSVGVAVHRQAAETVDRAGAALHRAKQEGRGRWLVAPPGRG
jgi:GGDEF domain-containing protein